MTTVLVTGGTGLLGGHLVPYLRDRGYKVIRHARSEHADIRCDLSDIAELAGSFDGIMPDVVVNLAALTDVDLCEQQPNLAFLANVRSVENLVEWIGGKRPHPFLIHISTDQVYDGPGANCEEGVSLTNCYAFSKYAGEIAARAVPSTVVRTNFFGPSRTVSRRSFSDWLIRNLSDGTPTTVFDDVRFSPLSLGTLTELLALLIAHRHQGVFNVGARTGMSKAEFAFALAETLSLPVSCLKRGVIDTAPLPAYRPRNMVMDSTRLEGSLGVKLPDLEEEIQSMKKAYSS